MATLDYIREYFVLNRIKNGASPNHLRPLEVGIDVYARKVNAVWPVVVDAATRRLRRRDDNVASEDEIAMQAAVKVALPEETAGERAWLLQAPHPVKAAKKKAAKEKAAIVPPAAPQVVQYPLPGKCPCYCDSPRGYLNNYTYFNHVHTCVFKDLRCKCGCEDDQTEDDLRARRLAEHLGRAAREEDPLDRVKVEYADWRAGQYQRWWQKARQHVHEYEEKVTGVFNPAKAVVDELARRKTQLDMRRKQFERYMALPADLRKDGYKSLEQHEDEVKRRAEMGNTHDARVLLQDVNAARMPLDAVNDGMIAAVQQLHSLRVFHRNISLKSFAVLTPLDSEDVPTDKPRVVMRDWSRACFNPGNTSYRNDQRNTFAAPTGEVAPELSGDIGDRTEYGFEYDIWCLGLAIFELMYETALTAEVDPADFTDAWLAEWISKHRPTRPLENTVLYEIVLRVTLTTNVDRRAASYALLNMTDGPRGTLFEKQPEVTADERDRRGGPRFQGLDHFSDTLGHYAEDPVATARRVRDHALQPRVQTPGHWAGCTCPTCAPGLSAIVVAPNKTRTERTRVMYALACIYADYHMSANVVLAVYSQLADAILTDSRDLTIDPADYGITPAKLETKLARIAPNLKELRIRL